MGQGSKIKLFHSVYAGKQKQQKNNLTRLPAGSIGIVKFHNIDDLDEYYLVKFKIDDETYWAKINPHTSCEILEDD